MIQIIVLCDTPHSLDLILLLTLNEFKNDCMILASPSIDISNYGQYAEWLIVMLIVAFGFRYARKIVVFVLDTMYRLFIQHNPPAI